jgi:hypothetical protein
MIVKTTSRMTPKGSAYAPIRVVIASALVRASIAFSSPRGPHRSPTYAPIMRLWWWRSHPPNGLDMELS